MAGTPAETRALPLARAALPAVAPGRAATWVPPAASTSPIAVRPAAGAAAAVSSVAWTTVAVDRRGDRLAADLRRGALAPYRLDDDGHTVRVALVASGALLLGGDHVGIRVRVGAGAVLELVETSGTVAYDGRGRAARWEVDVEVHAGGALIWNAQPFVVATGADVHRTTSVRLGDGAVACLRETVVLGRSGTPGGRLLTSTRVDDPAGPVLHEELRLDGARPQPGVLGDHRVVDSVVLVGRRPPVPAGHVGTGPAPTVLALEGGGAVARRLGTDVHRVALTEVAAHWCRLAGGIG